MREILLENDADVNIKDSNGRTPLYLAARGGNTEIIAMLLKNGADPNIVNNNGLTPLHLVASQGNIEAVELLLTNGADLYLADDAGITPIEAAPNDEISQIFIEIDQQHQDAETYETRVRKIWPTTSAYRELLERLSAGPTSHKALPFTR